MSMLRKEPHRSKNRTAISYSDSEHCLALYTKKKNAKDCLIWKYQDVKLSCSGGSFDDEESNYSSNDGENSHRRTVYGGRSHRNSLDRSGADEEMYGVLSDDIGRYSSDKELENK